MSATLATLSVRPDYDLPRCRQEAEELARRSIGVADAAHLAFAIAARADFVTCDDRLVRRVRRVGLPVWAGSPVAFCQKEDLR